MRNKRSKTILLALSLTLIAPLGAYAADNKPEPTPEITKVATAAHARLAGANRFLTNQQIAASMQVKTKATVYVVAAQSSASIDALVAAAHAAKQGAPVIMLPAAGVSTGVKTQLEKLSPAKIVLIGNISAAAHKVLDSYAPLTEISGANRYETAAKLSRSSSTARGGQVFVANGNSFSDTLVAATAAGRSGGQVLLTQANSLPEISAAALREAAPSKITIVGGNSAVSAKVQTGVRAQVKGAPISRLAGADRFATAAKAATLTPSKTVFYTNESAGADTVSAIPLAAQRGANVLLVNTNCVPQVTLDTARNHAVNNSVIIGGKAVVADSAFSLSCEQRLQQAAAVAAAQVAAQAAAQAAAHARANRDPKQIALDLFPQYGFAASQHSCLVNLWGRESGWRVNAGRINGPYGIPQALPGRKMAAAGADWRTNPETQIKWGLGYIKGRYGSPCGAWNHFLSRHWY